MRLALVVVEEHARGTVHLGDDDTLGSVDHEGTVLRHQRHVAHIDVLLLDVSDGAGTGLFLNVPDNEAQGYLQRRREGNSALLALLHVIFRRLELIADELEHCPLGEVLNRENRFEDFLKPQNLTVFDRHVFLQEQVVGAFLNLNQVRHWGRFENAPEILAHTLATGEGTNGGNRHGQTSPTFRSNRSGRDGYPSAPWLPRPSREPPFRPAGKTGLPALPLMPWQHR